MDQSCNSSTRRRALAVSRLIPPALCALCAAVATVAHAATLEQLLGGNSITAGNALFSDWQLLEADATSGALPQFSLVTVNPIVGDPLQPGLQWAGNGQLSVAGVNAIDLIVRFKVTPIGNSNSFTGQSLQMTGITFGAGGGLAYISDEGQSFSGAGLAPALVFADQHLNQNQFTATAGFAPQPALMVTTSIFLTGISVADAVNLTTFTQQFAQDGPSELLGDYNENGIVDAADYVVWRKQSGPPQGYSAWRTNFGVTDGSIGSITGGSQKTTVPEPSYACIVSLIAIGLIKPARRRLTHRFSGN